MFHCIKPIIFGLFLGLTLNASAEIKIKPHDEKVAGRYGPLSEEYRQFDRDDLRGMTAEKLGKMLLEDPLLRHAYISIFFRNLSEPDTLEPEEVVVLEDMRSRGDDITPLLLDLARQNQDSIFESALLDGIAEAGNINLEPYLEYARKLLRERTQTINYSLAVSASMLLANHGSKQDLALLEQVIAERSYTARRVTESLKVLNRRLERTKQATRPILKGEPSATDSADAEAQKQLVANRDGYVSTRSLMMWVTVGIVLCSLVWLLLKSVQRSPK